MESIPVEKQSAVYLSPTSIANLPGCLCRLQQNICANKSPNMSSEKVMNAVRFHGREDLRFEQVPEPECGKGKIKIKPAWCGICGRVRERWRCVN